MRDLDTIYGAGKWHCDDLDDTGALPACVHAFLAVARAPAWPPRGDAPPLFASYEGRRVRVVMASRFGDVGITENLKARHGYSRRVVLPDLTDFSAKP